jgi:hypothetical protein
MPSFAELVEKNQLVAYWFKLLAPEERKNLPQIMDRCSPPPRGSMRCSRVSRCG